MQATPCNPPRSDAQDQSGYHADLKDFWNQRMMEEATLTIWKHPFKCHLHTRDDWLHSWSYHTVSTVRYKYIVRIYQLKTHVIHRVTCHTASSSSFGDWRTLMRLMYPYKIDVPLWDWCTLMRLMHPHEIDVTSWDWCTLTCMRLMHPYVYEINAPSWDWCTLMTHCTLSNTQNNLLPTHGHWASSSLLPCTTLGDAGFSLRRLTDCTQEWIKHNNNPFNT